MGIVAGEAVDQEQRPWAAMGRQVPHRLAFPRDLQRYAKLRRLPLLRHSNSNRNQQRSHKEVVLTLFHRYCQTIPHHRDRHNIPQQDIPIRHPITTKGGIQPKS